MPDTYAAEPRIALGKAAAVLRRGGTLPANIFGRGLESTAIQLPTREARSLLLEHGVNTLVNLQVAGESVTRPVVVRHVQRHPVSKELQHVDFYQVDLQRVMEAELPVVVIGEAPAVNTYKGVLLNGVTHVHVSGLPANMPQTLEVSVDSITELEGEVTVADLKLPAGVTVLTPADTMLARVTASRAGASEDAAVPEGEQPAAT
jgi:large subunit ribosomal protein L25